MLEEIAQYEKERRERLEQKVIFQVKNVGDECSNSKNLIKTKNNFFQTCCESSFVELLDNIDAKMEQEQNCSQKRGDSADTVQYGSADPGNVGYKLTFRWTGPISRRGTKLF
jgi:hypothetical protein